MCLTILGAESLGVRSLCCLVKTADRRIVIDPGIALGYVRYGLLPHPLQVAVGRMIRKRIIRALDVATDVVVSHFHGDHVPLAEANPYQLSIKDLPSRLRAQRCWTIGDPGEPAALSQRFADISSVFGRNMSIAEGSSDGPLSFSEPVPHGGPQTQLGTVMMTRIENHGRIFVHASDIQLLDNSAVDRIIAWRPTTVLAAGPPLYLGRLGAAERKRAWDNAIRLVEHVSVVILDHHLMRSAEGEVWLSKIAQTTGRRVYCAADYMGKPRRLLEAERKRLYDEMPVPPQWHSSEAAQDSGIERYFGDLGGGAAEQPAALPGDHPNR